MLDYEDILLCGKKLQKLGIKSNDALQISCAVFSDCDYFITTDKKLINKKVKGIEIINPIDFVNKMEELD